MDAKCKTSVAPFLCLSAQTGVEYGPLVRAFILSFLEQAGPISMQSRKGRILYTEDDADSRELIRFVFMRYGYEVVCAESGPEALELARLEQFDLLLVDNWMPGLTGVELTRHIRTFNQTTPILFYSGAAHDKDRQAALNAGAQAYLTKPADIDDLIAEAERLITRTI